jgi:hypothetical protein
MESFNDSSLNNRVINRDDSINQQIDQFSNIDLNNNAPELIQQNKLVDAQSGSTFDQSYSSFGADSINNSAVGVPKTYANYVAPSQSVEGLNGSYRSPSNSVSNGFTNYNNGSSYNTSQFNSTSSGLSSLLNTNISPQAVLNSASEASTKLAHRTASTIETLRIWGKSAYKCTRQLVSEKLGKTSRTLDPEIEASIEVNI